MNITSRNKVYYVTKGYSINSVNEVIEIMSCDLPRRSNALNEVQCDYCLSTKSIKYCEYQI